MSRQCSQLILIVVLNFFAEKSKINICLLSTFSECLAPWTDVLALGQTDKTSTENLKQLSDVTPILQTTSTMIFNEILPCASYKRLKSMYLVVLIACFRVNVITYFT